MNRLGTWNILLVWLALEGSAAAGGLFVPGAGPSAQGRAGAFVARADDPTTMSHNPAGFAKQDGTQLYVGSNFLRYVLSYQRSGSYEAPGAGEDDLPYEGQPFPKVENDGDAAIGPLGSQVLPTFVVTSDLGHPEWPVRFAVGLYSVQAFPSRRYGRDVTLDSGQVVPAPQRYDVVSQEIILSAPSLAVTYSPTDTIDIGVRGSWGLGSFKGSKTVWTLPNYEESPNRDAIFTLTEAKDNFIPTMGLGVLYRPSNSFEFGAAWNSQGQIDAKGTGSSEITGTPFGDATVQVIPRPDDIALCGPGGVTGELKACVSLTLAQNATVGGRWIHREADGREKADIELNVKWEDWSVANKSTVQVDGMVDVTGGLLETVANPHGYQDVISTRLGGGYRIDVAKGRLEVRAGVAYDTKTAPASWTRADQDGKRRATFATGLGFEHGRYRLDLGFGAVWEPDITVGQCKAPAGPSRDSPGCEDGVDPVNPTPAQPLYGEAEQKESPFNAGTYESGYLMAALGLKVSF
ncbi:MAG: hypothetical protein GY811_17010 [Myxococcales bacterium]|nr:hypothetical protein [Myxococcales bacterium]